MWTETHFRRPNNTNTQVLYSLTRCLGLHSKMCATQMNTSDNPGLWDILLALLWVNTTVHSENMSVYKNARLWQYTVKWRPLRTLLEFCLGNNHPVRPVHVYICGSFGSLSVICGPLSCLPNTDKLPNDPEKHVTIAWGQDNTQSMDLATILMYFAESGNKCPFMPTVWVGMFTLSIQQKAPRLVLQINCTLPAGTLDICSNSSIICQGGHFSGTSFLNILYSSTTVRVFS